MAVEKPGSVIGRSTEPAGSMARLRIPRPDEGTRQRLTSRFGAEIGSWFDELPRVLAALGEQWQLVWDAPIPRGSVSVVIRCRMPDGRPAVLKVSPDRTRLANEAAALDRWTTVHTPSVLAVDESVGALLATGDRYVWVLGANTLSQFDGPTGTLVRKMPLDGTIRVGVFKGRPLPQLGVGTLPAFDLSAPAPARPGSRTATASSHASTRGRAPSTRSPPAPPTASPSAIARLGRSAASSSGTPSERSSTVGPRRRRGSGLACQRRRHALAPRQQDRRARQDDPARSLPAYRLPRRSGHWGGRGVGCSPLKGGRDFLDAVNFAGWESREVG